MPEMNESVVVSDTSQTPLETKPRKEKKSRKVKKVNPKSIWNDPVVAFMGLLVVALVLAALAFVAIALIRGYIGSTAPKYADQALLVRSSQDVGQYKDDPGLYYKYVMQLIANKQYTSAQDKIDSGLKQFAKADVYDQGMMTAQAYLYAAKGDLPAAVKAGAAAQAEMTKQYEILLKSSQQPNSATAYGMSDNYYAMQLLLGGIYAQQGKYPAAIKELKAYLAITNNSMQSGVWIDLGNAYAKNGDTSLAEKAYKSALEYEPDNTEAKAALAKLGAK
ncbi:MAG: tetratricopeptide repeat protein [Coriobacteriia bacterium]|nr:tetratricopeptide repeat protein [Coriobacteriia bacterium]